MELLTIFTWVITGFFMGLLTVVLFFKESDRLLSLIVCFLSVLGAFFSGYLGSLFGFGIDLLSSWKLGSILMAFIGSFASMALLVLFSRDLIKT